MTGETDLAALLRGLSPVLDPMSYVFVSLPQERVAGFRDQALMVFEEAEGTTLVLAADGSLPETFSRESLFSRITLKVHSSLHAVGLTAAVSGALAQKRIPANIVAGFYHDHVFVPVAKGSDAIETLQRLSQ